MAKLVHKGEGKEGKKGEKRGPNGPSATILTIQNLLLEKGGGEKNSEEYLNDTVPRRRERGGRGNVESAFAGRSAKRGRRSKASRIIFDSWPNKGGKGGNPGLDYYVLARFSVKLTGRGGGDRIIDYYSCRAADGRKESCPKIWPTRLRKGETNRDRFHY